MTTIRKPVRFGISLTYRCNAACPGCNRYLDVAPWADSDLSPDDIKLGYARVVDAGIKIHKTRVTGGEPLLHPRFRRCLEIIGQTWNKDYGGRTAVFTNGSIPLPPTRGWRYNVSGMGLEKNKHLIFPMVSPEDLGVTYHGESDRLCYRQHGCGRLFDAFGFSFCILAGPIGRLLGIDPYHDRPVLDMREEICRHCIISVGVRRAHRLFEKAKSGALPYPTPTWRRAVERWRDGDRIELKRFQER